jgi:hypothetical protein
MSGPLHHPPTRPLLLPLLPLLLLLLLLLCRGTAGGQRHPWTALWLLVLQLSVFELQQQQLQGKHPTHVIAAPMCCCWCLLLCPRVVSLHRGLLGTAAPAVHSPPAMCLRPQLLEGVRQHGRHGRCWQLLAVAVVVLVVAVGVGVGVGRAPHLFSGAWWVAAAGLHAGN